MSLVYQHAAAMSREDTHPRIGETHPQHHHRGADRLRDLRPRRTNRNRLAALLRAHPHDRHLALRTRVASTRLDRHPGVRLEPMLLLPGPPRLLLRRLEQLRHPASEPMPDSVARPTRVNVACAGRVADRVREAQVRVAVSSARVPARAPLVLAHDHEENA